MNEPVVGQNIPSILNDLLVENVPTPVIQAASTARVIEEGRESSTRKPFLKYSNGEYYDIGEMSLSCSFLALSISAMRDC